MSTDWLVLTATLPTQPSALRVRIWRALKATGARTLREGVYLLPAAAGSAQAFWDIERAVQEGGAQAHMLVVGARDPAQEQAFRAMFDRSEGYADLLESIKETRAGARKGTDVQLRKQLRVLDQQFLVLRATDFFPGKHAERAANALATLRREIERELSPGEPTPRSAAMTQRSKQDYQHKTWATRKRPWVDRLATAWLIVRFVDRAPRFVWIDSPKKCPKGALGFDFDGATFTHVADKVTFEVVASDFGLEQETGLKRLGDLVHYIDVGGIPEDAAAGLEAIVRGLQAQHPENDDALLAAALPVFDALYASMKVSA